MMIDTGQKLFGFPIHVCEPGETLGGDKNLPVVRGALAFEITGVTLLPPVRVKTTAEMMAEGEELGEALLKARRLRRLDVRWRRKGLERR